MRIIHMPIKLVASVTDSAVTKQVKLDFNRLTDQEFMRKYAVSKAVYLKRVLKYGDPYMRAPLARIGKWLTKKNSHLLRKKRF